MDIDFDYLITVCNYANESCPSLSTKAIKFHYNFPDPAKAIGTEEEINLQFSEVRMLIKNYAENFINTYVKI